jgi:hypothetical protein
MGKWDLILWATYEVWGQREIHNKEESENFKEKNLET